VLRKLSWSLCCLGVLCFANPVDAKSKHDSQKAAEWYQLAMDAMKSGEWNQAALGFDAAYRLDPDSRLLYNAARAYDKGGNLEEARKRYKKFLTIKDVPRKLRKKALVHVAAILSKLERAGDDGDLDEPPKPKLKASRDEMQVDWFGFRVQAGAFFYPDMGASKLGAGSLSFELIIAGLTWEDWYVDAVRVGGGYPMLVILGTSGGLRWDYGESEFRFGLHLTMLLIIPTLSGVELSYLWDFGDSGAMELGLRQYSYPLGLDCHIGMRWCSFRQHRAWIAYRLQPGEKFARWQYSMRERAGQGNVVGHLHVGTLNPGGKVATARGFLVGLLDGPHINLS
jgi:hypothetical protein